MKDTTVISFPHSLPRPRATAIHPPAETGDSFLRFVFGNAITRRYLVIALVGVIAQFFVFKFLYPFPDFFSDSYSYIYAASTNLDVNIWPIGYSKFLAGFHAVTHSAVALVGFQYFFLELSALYFFFTWAYFFQPGRPARIVLFVFLFFNPLFLYISNYVNSDPLFAALSILWFTELIWIMNRPTLHQVFTQGVLLFLAFTIRNNAYIYPFITIIAFLLPRQRPWRKFAGCLLGPALILPFVLHTRAVAKEMTGTAQFSLFTGWQLANNALYMYHHIAVDSNQLPSQEIRQLDALASDFYRRTIPEFDEVLYDYPGNFFIREPLAPLKQYYASHYQDRDAYSQVVNWGKASAVFAGYGNFLIRNYPVSYGRYFMLLNAKDYFIPPLEKLQVYNLGLDKVDGWAQKWFDFKDRAVRSASKTVQGDILALFPAIFLLINLAFIGCMAVWVFNRTKLKNEKLKKGAALSAAFMLFNGAFCIFATIIVFRYEFFPMLVALAFDLVLLEKLYPLINTSGYDRQ